MKIQITIEQLEVIINEVINAKASDSSLSSTITLEQVKETDTHLGSDIVRVCVNSNYSECVGTAIYFNQR